MKSISVMRWLLAAAILVLLSAGSFAQPDGHPRLLSATVIGTAGPDDFQGVAFAPDGTILAVGNFDQLLTPPAGIPTVTLGTPVDGSWYRCGVVAQFSTDGKQLLRLVQFARGQVFLCSVAANKDGVYAGGYAVPQSAPLFADLKGFFPTATAANAAPIPWPLPGDPVKAGQPNENPTDNHTLTILSRSHGDKEGIPCVLRLDIDLSKLIGGTYLEGHHYAWNVGDDIKEDEWTPTPLGFLADGTLVVGHDGGVPGHYYYAPDYVSRLAPDLTKRVWRYDLFFPNTSIDKIANHLTNREPRAKEWRAPIFGQVRILGLRTNGKDGIYVCGWSVSYTSGEPWWVPFLFKLNANGDTAWKAYSFDPMSGTGDRVSGDVADSLFRNVALSADGDVLLSGMADGGNSVLRKNPLNYDINPQNPFRGNQGTAPYRGGIRYKGLTIRMSETLEMKSGTWIAMAGKPGWVIDLAGLPGKRIVTFGRHTYGYAVTPNAWDTTTAGPAAFLRVTDEGFKDQFLTSLPDVLPYAVAVSDTRVAAVGIARGSKAPVKDAAITQQAGGLDAYLLVADFPLPEEKPAVVK